MLTSNETLRARGYITADVRNQTEYGTVRGYLAVGINTNDTGLQVASLVDSANRAFVQWAGMTAGLSQSFFDFYSVPAMQYRGGYLPASDTGDGGWWVWAYTAQFGGGFSGTISSEARRTTQIIDVNGLPGPAGTAALAGAGTITPGGFPCAATVTGATGVAGTAVGGCGALFPGNGAYGGMQTTDFVANLRVDQAWGGAQIMGALHEVNATYYSAANALQSGPGLLPPVILATSGAGRRAWASRSIRLSSLKATGSKLKRTSPRARSAMCSTPRTRTGARLNRVRKPLACSATACMPARLPSATTPAAC